MKELILEVATPAGLYTQSFPGTTKIEEIISAVQEAMELADGEPLELVHNGEVLKPLDRPITSFDLICKVEMELVATGAGV